MLCAAFLKRLGKEMKILRDEEEEEEEARSARTACSERKEENIHIIKHELLFFHSRQQSALRMRASLHRSHQVVDLRVDVLIEIIAG